MRPEVEYAAKLVERYAAGKVPAHVQDRIRLDVDTVGNSITIWECRPPWRPEYGPEWTRMGIARFRYSPSQKSWTVYWMRSDLKFHRYESRSLKQGSGRCSTRSRAIRTPASGARRLSASAGGETDINSPVTRKNRELSA